MSCVKRACFERISGEGGRVDSPPPSFSGLIGPCAPTLPPHAGNSATVCQVFASKRPSWVLSQIATAMTQTLVEIIEQIELSLLQLWRYTLVAYTVECLNYQSNIVIRLEEQAVKFIINWVVPLLRKLAHGQHTLAHIQEDSQSTKCNSNSSVADFHFSSSATPNVRDKSRMAAYVTRMQTISEEE